VRPRTVLVTGGAGFIGRHLVAHLVAAGHDVRCLDRSASPADVASYPGDVRDPELVDRAVAGVHTLYHLAAWVGARASVDRAAEAVDVNVRGTAVLLQAAEVHKVRRVVLASSLDVFGDTASLPHGRAEVDHPRRPISPYGASKLAAEGLLDAFAATSRARCATVRLATVYGPRGRSDQAVGRFVGALRRDGSLPLFGDGTAQRDFLHVDDAVAELVRGAQLATDGQPTQRHGATGVATELRDLVAILRQISGRDPDIDVMPPQPGDPHTCLAVPTEPALPGGVRRTPLRAGLEALWSC